MINFFTVILIIFIVFFILLFKRKYIKRFLNKMNLFINKSLTNKKNTIKNLPKKINFNYQNSSKNRSEFHKTALIKKMFKLFQNNTEDKLKALEIAEELADKSTLPILKRGLKDMSPEVVERSATLIRKFK